MSTVTQLFAEPIDPAELEGNYTIKLKLSEALSTITQLNLQLDGVSEPFVLIIDSSDSTKYQSADTGERLSSFENKGVESVSYVSGTNQVNLGEAPSKICIKKPNDPMSCNNCMTNTYCGESCTKTCFNTNEFNSENTKCLVETDTVTLNIPATGEGPPSIDPILIENVKAHQICAVRIDPFGNEHPDDTVTADHDIQDIPSSSNCQITFTNVQYSDEPNTVAALNTNHTRNINITYMKVPDGFRNVQDFYKDIFNTYKAHHDALEEELPDLKLDVDFYNIRELPPDTIARSMFTLIKNLYDVSTFNTRNLYGDKRSTDQEIDKLKTEIDKKRLVINDLKSLNSTNKREIEINMYKTKKMRNTNKVLMIVMLVVGCLVLFPILSAAKVLPMMAATIIWAVGLIAVLGYMSYKLYFTDMNRDEIVYTKYNFVKPSEREVALSRAKAQLSDSDKARCQAFAELEEELDIPRINLDISEYKSDLSTAPSGCNRFEDTSS
jgi:hypothetical protein